MTLVFGERCIIAPEQSAMPSIEEAAHRGRERHGVN
jgi:hypothetical protein